jgi:hypothetical protein
VTTRESSHHYRQRLHEMVALVEGYPMCRMVEPAHFGEPLSEHAIRSLCRDAGFVASPTLVAFYRELDGFSLFWRVPEGLGEDLYDRYNATTGHVTAINWEMTHGILIPPLPSLLAPAPYELLVAEAPVEDVVAMAGRPQTDEELLAAVRPFDRYLARGNEDGCMALLFVPDEEERVVAITDSAFVDPRRPWMALGDYLDLVIAMAGEYGARYELSSRACPPGRLRFTPDELATFRRDIFRPLAQ